MNPYIKLAIFFIVTFALYLISYFLFIKQYKEARKDKKGMQISDFCVSLKRKILYMNITMGCVSALFALFAVDPGKFFGKEFTFVSIVLYVLLYLISWQTMRWNLKVVEDGFTLTRTFTKKVSFSLSDIKSVEILAVDALITLKSGKMYTIFGKSYGYGLFKEKLESAGLLVYKK